MPQRATYQHATISTAMQPCRMWHVTKIGTINAFNAEKARYLQRKVADHHLKYQTLASSAQPPTLSLHTSIWVDRNKQTTAQSKRTSTPYTADPVRIYSHEKVSQHSSYF